MVRVPPQEAGRSVEAGVFDAAPVWDLLRWMAAESSSLLLVAAGFVKVVEPDSRGRSSAGLARLRPLPSFNKKGRAINSFLENVF